MKKYKYLRVASIIGIIISCILMYFGFFITETGRNSPDNCTKTVKAEVIGYDYMNAPNGEILSTPLFKFKYKKNEYVSHFTLYSSSWDDYEVGTYHKLKINPNNLDEIRPLDRWQTIIGSYQIQNICIGAILFGVSIIIFVLTMFSFFRYRKSELKIES